MPLLSTQWVRQKPWSHTWRQTRSALAGTANNVVAVKAAAAVPKKAIERMFLLLLLSPENGARDTAFLETSMKFSEENSLWRKCTTDGSDPKLYYRSGLGALRTQRWQASTADATVFAEVAQPMESD
jgi:hypothetical protein